VLVVDKARLCCSLCSLALKRPIYQVSDIATQHPTPFLEKLGSCCLHTACD
jgi:hypothetical protein